MATGLTKGVHEVKAVYNGGSSTKPVVGASELLRVEVGDEYAPGYKEGDLVVKYMSFQDLQKLIDDAVAAGNTTIVLDHDFEFDIGNDTVPVVVPSGVTIDGQGHFVSGADASTIFNITGDNVVLKNITLTNAKGEEGGAVIWSGDNGTLENAVLANNTADKGGAILWTGDNANIVNSTFENNNASEGAGVVIEGDNANIEGSTFANNTADIGAGVVIKGNNATIEDSVFANNTADTGAGVVTSGNDTTIAGSTFANNTAMTGAGVVSDGEGTTISDSEFTGNNANTGAGAVLNGDDATVENSEFKDNLASEGAGAVLNGNNATVENSTFKDNHAETGAGVVSNGNGTTIADTTFENNTAETGAGAVLNGNGATVENATFTGNNATTGAGIVANGENTTVSDTTFTNNTAESGSVMVVGENATVDTNNVTAENNTNMDGKSDIMEFTDMSISVDGLNVTVDLTAKSGNVTGNITVTVDGKDYTAEVVDGKATITVDPLTYGLHILNVKYFGDDTHAVAYGIDMMSITPVKTVISIISVDENFLITGVLKDENGNVLANMEITYTANGENITVVTDSEGKFTAQGADNNKYTFAFNGLYELAESEKSITFNNVAANETATQITGSDFTQYSMDYYAGERGGNFTVQLKDVNGNPLANKTIKIGYNGVTLVRTTDENGNAIVQINLANAGRYTFAVVFLGDEDYKASMSVYSVYINKKPITISASAKKFKASVKTKKYTVSLKTIRGSSVDGKTYLKAGKKVTLTVNGKTYTAKINAKGKATFKITKLTKKGKYTATIKFAGDNSYKPASKKVKITIR
ncbi:Ig-like domain repeat protein [uncultured Methanobrevibacter sp.]|uniref:Ig-like domain repeat protein n=1 Tax=uncultured Methanobrevibacter sp. TaxID=253161 RepID=UPI0025E9E438|nr:Ig-like domain repeat protein [uncultured Methanobrevibacter sp.]